MAIKKVRVTIKSMEEFFEDTKKEFKKIDSGIFKKRTPELSFANFGVYIKTFTPKRMELLRIINLKKPRTISELAKITKRDFKNVHSDIKLLEMYDLIKLKKTDSGLMPILRYDEIDIRIKMPMAA